LGVFYVGNRQSFKKSIIGASIKQTEFFARAQGWREREAQGGLEREANRRGRERV
jgi:hypothetical protein